MATAAPSSSRRNFRIGPLAVGPGAPVRVMAILNASPESFYAASIARGRDAMREAAERAAAAGADILDIGAMSTAPYKETRINALEEAERIVEAIEAVRQAANLPVTADTARASVARAALDAGACAVNDVTGFTGDIEMAPLIAERGCGAILMANEEQNATANDSMKPIRLVRSRLEGALARAREVGIPDERIVVDPGIGFFRNQTMPWYEFDLAVLQSVDRVVELGLPVLVSVSRKSFIGKLLDRSDPEDRLPGSLAAAIWCVRHGVHIVRTHDVAATRDAIRMGDLLHGGALDA